MFRSLTITLIAFIFINSLSAQENISTDVLHTLEAREVDGLGIGERYSLGIARTLSNGHFVYGTTYANFMMIGVSSDSLYNDILEEDYFKLTLRDVDMNVLNEWYTSEYNNSTEVATVIRIHNIQETDEGVVVCAFGQNDTLEQDNLHFVKLVFDTDLEFQSHQWVSLPIHRDSLYHYGDLILNHRDNYVITGDVRNGTEEDPDRIDKFICEVDADGTIINYKSPIAKNLTPIIDGAIKQMSNSNYIVHPSYILDTFFNEVARYENNMSMVPRIEEISEDRFVFAGADRIYAMEPLAPTLNLEVLCLGRMNGSWDTIYVNTSYSPVGSIFPGIRTVEASDTNAIYFANHRGLVGGGILNTITIYSVALDGTLNWGYILGNDASYLPSNIVRLSNGNCLLIINKEWYHGESNAGADLEYVIFDQEGNPLDISTGLSEATFKKMDFLVYPNPVSDILTIKIDEDYTLSKPSRFQLVSSTGQLVKEVDLNDYTNKINVQNLPVGNYIGTIYQNGETVYSSSIIISH